MLETAPRTLGYSEAEAENPGAWQNRARTRLAELIGYRRRPGHGQSAVAVRSSGDIEHGPGGDHRRIYLAAWPGADIPLRLLWDPRIVPPLPVMLCLTGTNVGAHCALGESLNPADPIKIARGLDIAVQAAARGYLAVAVEQLAFGERLERDLARVSPAVGVDAAHHALMLGRTLIGLWTSDLSVVVDWLLENGAGSYPDIIRSRIFAMGHSAGGTTALFGAALDSRIGAVIAAGCVGSWRRNVLRRRDPEGQLAIPGILNWFEMSDVLALVAPRPLLVLSGREDHIWPFAEAERVVAEAAAAYAALGAADRLVTVAGPEGHRFYPALAWPAFDGLLRSTDLPNDAAN